MPRPSQKPEILAPQPGRVIRRNERRLNHKRPRPTHRIEKLSAAGRRRKVRPSRPQQHPRRHVLLQRRLASSPAIPPPVQTLTREIQGHHEVIPMSMRMHAHTRALQLHARPPSPRVAHRIDDSVLQLQRAEMRMRDGRMLPTEIAGERGARPKMLGPVDLTNSVIKRLRIDRLEPSHLEKHAIRHSRPQTRAISDLEVTREGDPGRSLTRVRRAQRNQLTRQQVRQPPRGADQKLQR